MVFPLQCGIAGFGISMIHGSLIFSRNRLLACWSAATLVISRWITTRLSVLVAIIRTPWVKAFADRLKVNTVFLTKFEAVCLILSSKTVPLAGTVWSHPWSTEQP